MSGYALKKDGSGWRAIGSESDCEDNEVYSAVEPVLVPSAFAAMAAKLRDINTSCESEIAAISAGYPASEVLSWQKQEAEARAYTADAEAVTPLLDSLVATRGISKAELASRVITKADLFAQLSGAIIGKRQGLEDQLDAISDGLTAEELEAPITPEVQALLDAVQWDAP